MTRSSDTAQGNCPAPTSSAIAYGRLALLCMMLTLGACTSLPESPEAESPEAPGMDDFDEALLSSLLREAELASSPQAEALIFEAAQLLFDLGQYEEAAALLDDIAIDSLPLSLSAEIIGLQSEILLMQDEPEQALSLLVSESLTALPTLSQKLQSRIRDLRARSFFATEQYLLSAQERIYLNGQLEGEAQADNHENIWEALMQLPLQRLSELSESSISYEFQGWYELAVIGLRYQYNLDLQQVELEQWQAHWGRHPAAGRLPQQLQLIANLSENRPSRIALLLPLQSTAGRVVRDGFMSAYFNARDIGINVPDIRFYDTTNTSDILALHQQARAEGAEMIIGPLLKQQVMALENVRNLGVPTLALNTIDGSAARASQLYQFALAPEIEAQQVARRAWEDGHRRVAILSPVENPGDDYYRRKRESFITEWESLGGIVASREFFDSDYTRVIENLLNLGTSDYRHEQLGSLLGTEPEFVPRRRQDIDFIFLIAQPGPARQIKPSLGYLYAGGLPVYATQDIYSGQDQPQVDRDLNGIYFSESPWLLVEEDDLKNQTERLFPQSSALNLRLQAFGVDAFRLYPRLSQLAEMEDGKIRGATGELYMTRDRRIHQEYSWARIENGLARVVDDR